MSYALVAKINEHISVSDSYNKHYFIGQSYGSAYVLLNNNGRRDVISGATIKGKVEST